MTTVVACFDAAADDETAAFVYHLAWMYAEKGVATLVVDLDPNAALLRTFFGDERMDELFQAGSAGEVGGLRWMWTPRVDQIDHALHVVLGVARDVGAGSAGHELRSHLERSAAGANAELVLLHLAKRHIALDHAALVAADHVITVLGTSALSLGALHQLEIAEPELRAKLSGYVLTQWLDPRRGRAAAAYARLDSTHGSLGQLRTYPSLEFMAREARKPMFKLTVADGALGSHLAAAQQAYDDFALLADRVAAATWRRNPA